MSQPAMNPAVLHCLQAYHHAQAAGKEKSLNPKATAFEKHAALHEAEKAAKAAYCQAMPTFRDHASIFDYIACVSHALLLDIIPEKLASKLLYSAQVALGALRAITQSETDAAKAQAAKLQPNRPTPSPTQPAPSEDSHPQSIALGHPGATPPTPSPSAPITPTTSTPPTTNPTNPAISANSANPAISAFSAISAKTHTPTPRVPIDPLIAHAAEALRRSLLEKKPA